MLDREARRLGGGTVLLGGDRGRLLRFRPGVVDRLADPAILRAVGRRLVQAGLAHPVPDLSPVSPREVTVVVPVRDRAAELDRCLQALYLPGPADRRACTAPTGPRVIVVDDASSDRAAIARVANKHGALLVRQDVNTGPAGARTNGLQHVGTPLVAFVDSDVAAPGLFRLLGHFDDPAVAAVAPRVVAAAGTSLLHRYAAARGPLDLGTHPAQVGPGRRVSYVPTAALLVRRDALDGFDGQLRYGEDVDLIWRLVDKGWSVRYDPRVLVRHHEPDRWRAWLTRRYRYGTSAAPLAQRHGDRLAPLAVHPWLLACWLLLAARHPAPAVVVALVPARRVHRTLRGAGLDRAESAATAARTVARGLRFTVSGLGGPGTVTTGPLLAGLLLGRRTRRTAALLLLAPPLLEHLDRRPAIDPFRWTAARVTDDLAYALGVWKGCWDARTTVPLRPRRG